MSRYVALTGLDFTVPARLCLPIKCWDKRGAPSLLTPEFKMRFQEKFIKLCWEF